MAGNFAPLPGVEAVALGGSRGGAAIDTDPASDVGLYVYTRGDIPLEARREIVEASGGATRLDLGIASGAPAAGALVAPMDAP